jgi:hypothetical protein
MELELLTHDSIQACLDNTQDSSHMCEWNFYSNILT